MLMSCERVCIHGVFFWDFILPLLNCTTQDYLCTDIAAGRLQEVVWTKVLMTVNQDC